MVIKRIHSVQLEIRRSTLEKRIAILKQRADRRRNRRRPAARCSGIPKKVMAKLSEKLEQKPAQEKAAEGKPQGAAGERPGFKGRRMRCAFEAHQLALRRNRHQWNRRAHRASRFIAWPAVFWGDVALLQERTRNYVLPLTTKDKKRGHQKAISGILEIRVTLNR
jgi:hypothetical protein